MVPELGGPMDPNDRIHCLMVDRRELRGKLMFWRAIAVALGLVALVLGYGYALYGCGVW